MRHIGLSNATAAQVKAAQRIVKIVCVQNMYNLPHHANDALIDSLAQEGIAYVLFFPLGGFSPLQSDALNGVAERLDATPMQVALAWLLHRAPNVLLIPGTSSVAHLKQNIDSVNLPLSPDVIAELDRIGASTPAP